MKHLLHASKILFFFILTSGLLELEGSVPPPPGFGGPPPPPGGFGGPPPPPIFGGPGVAAHVGTKRDMIEKKWPDDTQVEISAGKFVPITAPEFDTWLTAQGNIVPAGTPIKVSTFTPSVIKSGDADFKQWYSRLKFKSPSGTKKPTPTPPSGGPSTGGKKPPIGGIGVFTPPTGGPSTLGKGKSSLDLIMELISKVEKVLSTQLGDKELKNKQVEYGVNINTQPNKKKLLEEFVDNQDSKSGMTKMKFGLPKLMELGRQAGELYNAVEKVKHYDIGLKSKVAQFDSILQAAWANVIAKAVNIDKEQAAGRGLPFYELLLIWASILENPEVQTTLGIPTSTPSTSTSGALSSRPYLASLNHELSSLSRKV